MSRVAPFRAVSYTITTQERAGISSQRRTVATSADSCPYSVRLNVTLFVGCKGI